MADAPILGATKKVSLDDAVFGERLRRQLLHDAVRADLAARRQGTSKTKTRAEVRGGGAKPWRQKGTGRARAGSSRSPIWTGGGTVFGPQPRHYTFKVNRKERRTALRSALSVHAGRGSLAILDVAPFGDTPSTKLAAGLLVDWTGRGRTLVLVSEDQGTAALSFRNLDRVQVLPSSEAGVADILGAARLLVSESALAQITDRANGTRTEQEND